MDISDPPSLGVGDAGGQPHTHQLQLFLPSGCGTGRRALSFAVLLSVKGACKAFWFQLLFLPL